MKNIFAILTALIMLPSIALAQENDGRGNLPLTGVEPWWGNKPVQCAPLNDVLLIAKDKGLQTAYGGLGIMDILNDNDAIETQEVFVFLQVNLNTGDFAILEVSKDKSEACIIGKGSDSNFDYETLRTMTTPYIQQ